jgi:D-sedoheptulose 7-phosphate isomerase
MTELSLSDNVLGYFGRLKNAIDQVPVDRVEAMGEMLYRAYRHGKQVFVVGNGGSAATASHMACDLGKNTIAANRPRFRIMSLNDNVPLLSALANDVGYEHVFSEQLKNLIRPGDVLISISASGNSPNILEAMAYARRCAATNIALLGFDGGRAAALADEYVLAPINDYGIVEDIHMILDHVLTEYFRARLDEDTSLV